LRKKSFLTVLFCVIFLTGGVMTAREPVPAPGFTAYKDASSLYTVHYPSHWIVNESGNKVSFTGPAQEGPPAVTIEVRQGLQGSGLAEYASELKASYKLSIPGMTLVDETQVWISKREAYKFRMTYAIGDKTYHQENYLIPVARNFMEVSIRVPEKMLPQARETFNAMIRSLAIHGPGLGLDTADASPGGIAGEEDGAGGSELISRRRDPFIDPTQKVLPDTSYTEGGKPPGIEGMLFTEVDFVGIYSGKDGRIAIFSGTDKVGYFLKVGDRLWDGEIIKITDNAVHFRQKLVDQYSKKQYREVIKYLYPVEEGQ
jgi:hypothetical protein